MGPHAYIEKFERVVDLLRVTGDYTAIALVAPFSYEVTSNVITYLAEKNYLTLSGVKVRVTSIVDAYTFQVTSIDQSIDLAGIWKALAPYSMYGTRRTINMKLLERNGGEFAYQKYPLIAFRLPAQIPVSGGVAQLKANVLIAYYTNKLYREDERIANKFDPILWPLEQAFLLSLRKSGEFNEREPDYTRIDRMFYGTEAGDENIANIFQDPLDAVELRELNLTWFTDGCWSAPADGGGFEYLFEKVFES